MSVAGDIIDELEFSQNVKALVLSGVMSAAALCFAVFFVIQQPSSMDDRASAKSNNVSSTKVFSSHLGKKS